MDQFDVKKIILEIMYGIKIMRAKAKIYLKLHNELYERRRTRKKSDWETKFNSIYWIFMIINFDFFLQF